MSGKKSEPTYEREFPGQHEGEEVQFLFRQHPLVMRKALILGLLAILLGVVPLDFPQVYSSDMLADICLKLAIGVTAAVLVVWAWRYVGWYYTMYIVTTQRIIAIKQRGLFSRKVDEWQLDGIQNVNYEIGGFQAVLFGYGDINARTYIGDLEMKTIHKPAEIHEQLLAAVRRAGGGTNTGTAMQTLGQTNARAER
jgi:uncharacterized membrane protein YdbT with pleckstrin-like domain